MNPFLIGGLLGGVGSACFGDYRQQQGMSLQQQLAGMAGLGAPMGYRPQSQVLGPARVPKCGYCGTRYYERGRCVSCGAPEA